MTRLTLTLTVLLLLAAPAAAERMDLLEVLPEDFHLAVVVQDAPRLLADWKAGVWGRVWSDPEMELFLAPLRENMEIEYWEDEFVELHGMELSELLAELDGQVLMGVPDFFADAPDLEWRVAGDDFEMWLQLNELGYFYEPLVMMAHVAGDAPLMVRMMEQDFDKMEREALDGTQVLREISEHRGVEIHDISLAAADTTFALESWALVDGVMIMANPPGLLRRLVDRVLDGAGGASLAATPACAALRRDAPAAQLALLANVGPMVASLLADAGEPDPEEPFSDEDIVRILGLDKVAGAYVGVWDDGDEGCAEAGVVCKGASGLIGRMPMRPGPAPQPAFVPADVLSASTGRWDFNEVWEALRSSVGDVKPEMLAFVDYYVMQAATTTGVDVVGDLLANLSGVAFSTSAERDGVPIGVSVDAVMGFELKDPATFEGALSNLLTNLLQGAELFDTRDYLGARVHVMRETAPPEDEDAPPEIFSYAITDGYLLIGIGGDLALNRIIAAMRDPGPTLWQREDVAAALAGLPDAASQISYTDTAVTLRSVFMGSSTLDPTGMAAESLAGLVDPERLPSHAKLASLLGPTVTAAWREGGDVRLTWRVRGGER